MISGSADLTLFKQLFMAYLSIYLGLFQFLSTKIFSLQFIKLHIFLLDFY